MLLPVAQHMSRCLSAFFALVVLVLAGCGESSSTPRPIGPLAEAFATVGGGGANGSLGVGWAEPQLVEEAGLPPTLIADALGPNAGTVIDAATRLRRRFGFDPLAARRLVSVGGSYAFGLRVDGADAQRLNRELIDEGGRARRAGRIELVDVGAYAVVPDALLRSGVNGLGAFDAFGSNLTLLAISETARAALLGRGDRLIDEPTYRAAADCLGDVAVARMIPDNLLLSTDLGVSAVAMGVSDRRHEVLCVLGGTSQRADEVASALEGSLAAGAREPVTHDPISDSVARALVSRNSYDGVEVVKASLTLASGQRPGFLFETVSHGSLVRMLNGAGETAVG